MADTATPASHAPGGALHIGCAGWSLPRTCWPQFPGEGSHLQRYAAMLNAAEINSSFHRPHQPATYARWSECVPPDFRFSVKLPKTITHERRLRETQALLDDFLPQARGLGGKLGCLLVQLPPSLECDEAAARAFLLALRERYDGNIAMEPRHASWFAAPADALLAELNIARVLADPVLHPPGRWPGGWPGLIYLRLHGSPQMYRSSYGEATLLALAARMRIALDEGREVWCIFDNTLGDAASLNALELTRLLREAAWTVIA